jgi:hypothetical protein
MMPIKPWMALSMAVLALALLTGLSGCGLVAVDGEWDGRLFTGPDYGPGLHGWQGPGNGYRGAGPGFHDGAFRTGGGTREGNRGRASLGPRAGGGHPSGGGGHPSGGGGGGHPAGGGHK